MHYLECETLKDSPAKITLHSVRILAAVILFADRATDSIIMRRLQYKSNKLRIYYRNVPALSAAHSRAVTAAETYKYIDCAMILDDKDDQITTKTIDNILIVKDYTPNAEQVQGVQTTT